MVEMIFGVALIFIGTLLFRSFSLSGKKMEAMESTETSTVEFLNSLSQSMAEGVGAGSFRYASEIKGKVVCHEPLISELAQVECVHYFKSVLFSPPNRRARAGYQAW